MQGVGRGEKLRPGIQDTPAVTQPGNLGMEVLSSEGQQSGRSWLEHREGFKLAMCQLSSLETLQNGAKNPPY